MRLLGLSQSPIGTRQRISASSIHEKEFFPCLVARGKVDVTGGGEQPNFPCLSHSLSSPVEIGCASVNECFVFSKPLRSMKMFDVECASVHNFEATNAHSRIAEFQSSSSSSASVVRLLMRVKFCIRFRLMGIYYRRFSISNYQN